jgi:Protein of unknown function (DUF1236)
MRKMTLLSTAAAIAMIGGSVAMAQGMAPGNKSERAAPAPAAQQNAPAEKMAPAIHHGRSETTGQGTPQRLEPGHGANVQPHANKPHETTGQAPSESMKGKIEAPHQKPDMKSEGGNKTEGLRERNEHSGRSENGHNEHMGATKEHNRTTTGQGAAGARANLSHEQRSKIVNIFQHHRHHRLEPGHLNISIHVGARIPRHVHIYPLPVEVVHVYPEWRGYDYILVGDEILVIDPASHEIVAVLEA